MKISVIAALFSCATVLAACQGVQHATPSGKPEVTIAAPSADVKTAFVGTLTNLGYTMTKDSTFQIAMERPIDNVMANVLLSSSYDPTVEGRLTATFLEMGGNTRVTTDMGVVRNGGSAFEAVTPVHNSPDSVGLQMLLQEIKTGLESGQPVAVVVAAASQRGIADRAKAAKAAALPKPTT
ncbi:MAG: hypothetical protein EOQ56_04290 [Mesorhizobium sp.]|nr:MAG: hypothetical protein EOQ56_04290 [Mesorhizobium sp.]